MPATQPNTEQFDLYKYFRVFWRRKWLLIAPLVVCLVASIVLAYWYPIEFESYAVLELAPRGPSFTREVEHVNISNEVGNVRNAMLSFDSVREIILSRKIDFGEEIDPDDSQQIDWLYHKIRRTSVYRLGPKHIGVRFRSTVPERNAALVNALVKRYVGEDRVEAQRQAKQDLKYYQDHHDKAKARLDEVEGELREFEQNNPWLRDTISELHRDYREAVAEEAALRTQADEKQSYIKELDKELDKALETIIVEVEPEMSPRMREYLEQRDFVRQMQERLRRLNERYTPAHRVWQQTSKELARAEAKLKALERGLEGTEPEVKTEERPNPEYAKLQARRKQAKKDHDKLQQRIMTAQKRVAEMLTLRKKAPGLLVQRDRLREQRAGLMSLVRSYRSRLGVAQRKFERLSNEAYNSKFRVREYARVSYRPVRDTKFKIVFLGAIIGLVTGAALIALVEYLDQTLKTVDDARECLGLPALGVIPAIFTPRDYRRRLWFRVLAVSSALFVVGVGVAIYLTVPEVQGFLQGQWVNFQAMMRSW